MHKYFIKTPWILKQFFSSYIWHLPSNEKAVYLSFDDGPHSEITPWILDQLKQYNAFATFFCIGKNVQQLPQVYQQILMANHAVGNHTHTHLNGWKTSDKKYLEDVTEASKFIRTNLFRPPYGRIKSKQAKRIPACLQSKDAKIIMWDVLSADFDDALSPQDCLANVLQNIKAGSIVVFHDSEKAFHNLEYTLPKLLDYLTGKGYILKKIEL